MKKIRKRIVALVCLIAMLAVSVNVLPEVRAEASPTGLTKISWSDVGITEDTTIVGGASDANNWGVTEKPVTSGKNLANSSFRGTIRFRRTTSANQYFQYGAEPLSTMNTKGIRFAIRNDGKLTVYNMANGGTPVVSLDATTAGLSGGTFINTAFELGIDVWQPEGSADLKMIVYINGQQYGSEPYVITNGAANMNAGMVLVAQGVGDFIDVTAAGEKAPDNLAKTDWSDVGITEDTTIVGGASDANNWGVTEKPVTSGKNLVNSSFRGTIRFRRTTSANQYFQYGAERLSTMNTKGIRFAIRNDGKLTVYNMANGGTPVVSLDATTAGLSSGTFIDTAFELGIDVWQPEGSADLKMIVYINGQQYGSEPYVITNGAANMNTGMVLVAQGVGDFIDVTVKTEESPGNLTEIDWTDFGITENKTCATGGGDVVALHKNEVTQLGMAFRGNVKFHRTADDEVVMLAFASTGWTGLRVSQEESKLTIQGVDLNWKTTNLTTITKEQAKVSSFTDKEMELGLNIWTENGADVRVDVFINGEKMTDTPCVWPGAVVDGRLPSGLYGYASGNSSIELLLPEAGADVIPDGLTRVTWDAFGIEENDFGYTTGGFSKIGTNREVSLKGVSFRGKIQFHGVKTGDRYTGLTFGDNRDGWQLGLNFIPQEDGTLRVWNRTAGTMDLMLDPQKVGLSSFVGEAFELGIDSWTEGENIKFVFFINGIRYNEVAYVWEGGVNNPHCYDYLTIGLLIADSSTWISVIYPEVEMEASPENLQKITWADFAIGNQKYTSADAADASGLIVKSNRDLENLLDTSFTGKIQFDKQADGGNLLVCYGCNGWGWDGIRFSINGDGNLRFQGIDLVNHSYPVITDVSPKKAGISSFYGQMVELRIDIWKSGADVKINIFVNGVQCTPTAFVWEDAVTNKCIGNGANLIVEKPGDSLEMQSVVAISGEPIVPDSSLKQISFSRFGIRDGVYTSTHPDFAAQGGFFHPVMGQTLNGTLFNADFCFNGEAVEIRYGGLANAWEGLVLRSSGKNLLLVDTTGLLCTFTPEYAGTDLTGSKVNLQISLLYVDSDADGSKDDVKLGFWFNGVLYKNEFLYLTDYAKKLGAKLGIYIPEGNGSLGVTSGYADNSIDFTLFGFTKNFKQYLKTTGKPKSVKTKL